MTVKKLNRHFVLTSDGNIQGNLFLPSVVTPRGPLIICIHGVGSTGNYFDLEFNSFAEAAARRGMSALLIDRPGHGGSAAPPPGPFIDSSANAVAMLLNAVEVMHTNMAGRPIALVGHSFGGAVAMVVAQRFARTNKKLISLCLSGIGDQHTSLYSTKSNRQSGNVNAPPEPYFLFGPGKTYNWHGIASLRRAAAVWRAEELDELSECWPQRWGDVAGAIRSPVHFRLAEFEHIWETTPQAISRVTSAFSQAITVDAAIAPEGGHLYEAHLRGHELVASQLDFISGSAASAEFR